MKRQILPEIAWHFDDVRLKMKEVCKSLTVIFLLLPYYGYADGTTWHFDQTYTYEDFLYLYGSRTLDQSVIRIGSDDGYYLDAYPSLSYFTDKDSRPLYELKNGNKLYKNGELICKRDKIVAYGVSGENFLVVSEEQQKIMFSVDSKGRKWPPRYREAFCPDAVLLFSADLTQHLSTHSSRDDGYVFSMVLDHFDGEWGRMDDVLKGNKPLYVRVPKAERHKFDVGLSRNEAVHAARALIPNFDKHLKEFLECLKDKNSKCSNQLRRAIAGPTLEELKAEGATPNLIRGHNVLKENPTVSDDLINTIQNKRLPVVRAELIAYLERDGINKQEFHNARFFRQRRGVAHNDGNISYRFEYGMYLKDIDSLVSIFVNEKGAELNLVATGTFIAPYMEDKESTHSVFERRVFAAEMIHEMRLGGEVEWYEPTEYVDPFLYLRRLANDPTSIEAQQKKDYRENMNRRGIDP